jgi:hypothetical protein
MHHTDMPQGPGAQAARTGRTGCKSRVAPRSARPGTAMPNEVRTRDPARPRTEVSPRPACCRATATLLLRQRPASSDADLARQIRPVHPPVAGLRSEMRKRIIALRISCRACVFNSQHSTGRRDEMDDVWSTSRDCLDQERRYKCPCGARSVRSKCNRAKQLCIP